MFPSERRCKVHSVQTRTNAFLAVLNSSFLKQQPLTTNHLVNRASRRYCYPPQQDTLYIIRNFHCLIVWQYASTQPRVLADRFQLFQLSQKRHLASSCRSRCQVRHEHVRRQKAFSAAKASTNNSSIRLCFHLKVEKERIQSHVTLGHGLAFCDDTRPF